MKFKRGRVINESLDIGFRKIAPDIFCIGQKDYEVSFPSGKHLPSMTIFENSQCKKILSGLELGLLDPSEYMFHEITKRDPYNLEMIEISKNMIEFKNYRGKFVKWRDQYFEIPLNMI